jgi:hypothetical protein
VNLKFLVDAGLISDPDRRKNIEKFLVNRAAGEGPALPSQVSTALPVRVSRVSAEAMEQLAKSIASLAAKNQPTKEQQEIMMQMMQMMMQDEHPAPPPPKPPNDR